jgi:hypothetical protein
MVLKLTKNGDQHTGYQQTLNATGQRGQKFLSLHSRPQLPCDDLKNWEGIVLYLGY